MTDRHPLRLTPLPADEWDDRTRAVLTSLIPAARANPGGAGNVLSTLVRHPDLTEAYLPFNTYLLNGSPCRRESARWLCYAWCTGATAITCGPTTFRSRAGRD
jgi:hypothetical protein